MATCPVLHGILKQCPEVISALIAILAPKSKLSAHTGWYKGIFKYHLPLIVPKCGDCRIRVDKTWIDFEENKSIMFDDTFEHEVRNNCDEYRVILLFDVRRNDLNRFLSAVNSIVLLLARNSSEVKAAIQNAEIQVKI